MMVFSAQGGLLNFYLICAGENGAPGEFDGIMKIVT
jgi:hypothetical protein